MNTKNTAQHFSVMADPTIVKELCGNLKQMRLNKNLSQDQLAQKSGLNRVTISRMEAGRAATILTIVQVLRALDKLDILNVFREELEISPMQLLKMQERHRKKASSKKSGKNIIASQ